MTIWEHFEDSGLEWSSGDWSVLIVGFGDGGNLLYSNKPGYFWVGLSVVERIRQVTKFRVGLNVVECMSG